MQQSGYIEVASIICLIRDDAMRIAVAQHFATHLGNARPQFKRGLFMKACNALDA